MVVIVAFIANGMKQASSQPAARYAIQTAGPYLLAAIALLTHPPLGYSQPRVRHNGNELLGTLGCLR
eukprot:1748947-Prorocentrum_lima.AAC.1